MHLCRVAGWLRFRRAAISRSSTSWPTIRASPKPVGCKLHRSIKVAVCGSSVHTSAIWQASAVSLQTIFTDAANSHLIPSLPYFRCTLTSAFGQVHAAYARHSLFTPRTTPSDQQTREYSAAFRLECDVSQQINK